MFYQAVMLTLLCFFLACEMVNLCLTKQDCARAFAGGEGEGTLPESRRCFWIAARQLPARAGCSFGWTTASVAHPQTQRQSSGAASGVLPTDLRKASPGQGEGCR